MKRFACLLFFVLAVTGVANAQTADFEKLNLGPNSYWNGSDGSGGFKSGNAQFNNNYNTDYNSWDGFAYSNLADAALKGFDAQYNAIPGYGANGSKTYAVVYWSSFAAEPPTITLDRQQVVSGAYFTNSNYTYYSMLEGDRFAKKFDENDWLKITITGYDESGQEKAATVDVNLAKDGNIVKTWKWVDLSGLGAVKELKFTMSSSDTDEVFGMNTPAYFAMDNFNEDDGSGGSTCFIRAAGADFFSGMAR